MGLLLGRAKTNPKTKKLIDEFGLEAVILHLAPADLSGYEACPFRSVGCSHACLNTAGRGQMSNTQDARIRKTRWFFEDRAAFMAQLSAELEHLVARARRKGRDPVARLNATSDIYWEQTPIDRDGATHLGVPQAFPEIQFYDYTKAIPRLRRQRPANYALTFSLAETNDKHAIEALGRGVNVAAVIRGERPSEMWGYPVIDGDLHDFRFFDPSPVIVALTPKGHKAREDDSGFVRDASAALDPSKTLVLARAA